MEDHTVFRSLSDKKSPRKSFRLKPPFTKYNAPAYAPGVQQFHLQPTDDLVEIGGYPIVNVYANLHLKRTRIFAMMYHVNAGMGSANSFLVPHYPINPRLFKIGVSWNFYD